MGWLHPSLYADVQFTNHLSDPCCISLVIGQDRHIWIRNGSVTIVWSIWSMVVYDYITWYVQYVSLN